MSVNRYRLGIATSNTRHGRAHRISRPSTETPVSWQRTEWYSISKAMSTGWSSPFNTNMALSSSDLSVLIGREYDRIDVSTV